MNNFRTKEQDKGKGLKTMNNYGSKKHEQQQDQGTGPKSGIEDLNNNKTEEQDQGVGLKTTDYVRTKGQTIEKDNCCTLTNLKLRNIIVD